MVCNSKVIIDKNLLLKMINMFHYLHAFDRRLAPERDGSNPWSLTHEVIFMVVKFENHNVDSFESKVGNGESK